MTQIKYKYESKSQCSKLLLTEEEIEAAAMKNAGFLGIYRIAPIEKKKFWLLAIMFFIICFIYSIIRELKDAFVVKKQHASSISFLKGMFMPFIAVLLSMAIQKELVNSTNKKILSYVLLIFSFYFTFYAIIILPIFSRFEPSPLVIKNIFCDGKMFFKNSESFLGFISLFLSWKSSIHFIAAEAWTTVTLSLLFMGFLNDCCTFKQFLRFMPLLSVTANFGLILSSGAVYLYLKALKSLTFRASNYLTSIVFFAIAILCFITYCVQIILEKTVLCKPSYVVQYEFKKNKKEKVSFCDGLKTVFTSKLALAMCAMVLLYSIGNNMAETNYKSCISTISIEENTDACENLLENQIKNQLFNGVFVIILLLTPFSRLTQIAGWTCIGIVSPLYSLLSSCIIFGIAFLNTTKENTNGLNFCNEIFGSLSQKLGITMRHEVFINMMCDMIYKVFKYAAFDLAKEAIGMRIDAKYRARFKGVYDGMCNKFGKAFGSIIALIIGSILNTNDIRNACVLYLFFSIIFGIIWIIVVFYLGKKYRESIENNCSIDICPFRKE